MKMLKKKDDGKKPMAKASKPVVKTPAPKAKATAKPKPFSNSGKFGLGSVAKTVKGQGEMKQMMAPPKKKYTPTPAQKVKSAEAGREAAQKSREEGKKAGYFRREADRFMQGITNSDKTKDSKLVKRSKSGGVIDQTKSKYSRNLYSGLNNKQLGYE